MNKSPYIDSQAQIAHLENFKMALSNMDLNSECVFDQDALSEARTGKSTQAATTRRDDVLSDESPSVHSDESIGAHNKIELTDNVLIK